MARPTAVGKQYGMAYLALLVVIAGMAAALAATATVWHTAQQREKEKTLLYVGECYRRAIGQYYESALGDKRYPTTLDDLLLDKRMPGVRRYLRRLYTDPLTGANDWGLVVAPQGGIMGVYSPYDGDAPLKQGGFAPAQYGFENATRYADWQFVYAPQARSFR